jgi:hypothetical protein
LKIKILFLALFVAGVTASMAIAKPPPGKGNPHKGGSGDATAAPAASTPSLPASGKVVLCHRTGSKSNPWVRLSVSVKAAAKRLKKGDTLAAADGTCAGAKAKPSGGDDDGGSTTTAPATTTTDTTTTVTTPATTTTGTTP